MKDEKKATAVAQTVMEAAPASNLLDCCVAETEKRGEAALSPEIELVVEIESLCCGVWSVIDRARIKGRMKGGRFVADGRAETEKGYRLSISRGGGELKVMRQLIEMALATAAISFTCSKSTMPIVQGVREWASRRAGWIRELLHCPYCTSNWVAALLLVVYPLNLAGSQYGWLNWGLDWQALVGASMVPIFGIFFVSRQG